WVELSRHIHRVELSVIEGVVKFPSELNVAFLVFQGEGLKERNVVIVESREYELPVIAVVADVAAAAGPLEDRCVEPLVDTALVAGQRSIARLDHSTGLAAAREIETVCGGESDI